MVRLLFWREKKTLVRFGNQLKGVLGVWIGFAAIIRRRKACSVWSPSPSRSWKLSEKSVRERKKERHGRFWKGIRIAHPPLALKEIYTQDRRVLCLEGLLRRSTSVVLESQMRLGEQKTERKKGIQGMC